MMWGGSYGFDGGFSWLGMGLMMLFMLLITVGVVVLIVWLVQSAARGQQRPNGGIGGLGGGGADAAIEEARRRFARGEITREQYEEIVQTLSR